MEIWVDHGMTASTPIAEARLAVIQKREEDMILPFMAHHFCISRHTGSKMNQRIVDDKQNNTDDFDEERIDKQRYAKKQEEAVNPGGPGMNNDQPAHPGGQLLRYRFTNLEQQFTQPPSSHFKATVLQVLKPKRVRQDIITVKTASAD